MGSLDIRKVTKTGNIHHFGGTGPPPSVDLYSTEHRWSGIKTERIASAADPFSCEFIPVSAESLAGLDSLPPDFSSTLDDVLKLIVPAVRCESGPSQRFFLSKRFVLIFDGASRGLLILRLISCPQSMLF